MNAKNVMNVLQVKNVILAQLMGKENSLDVMITVLIHKKCKDMFNFVRKCILALVVGEMPN